MAVIGISGQGAGGEREAFAVGDGEGDFGTEFIGLVGLALGETDNLGRVQAVELVLGAALLGEEALDQPEQRGETSLRAVSE